VNDPYDILEYLKATARGIEVRALLDRNLTSRAIRLVHGVTIDHGQHDSRATRIAAACMAFLIAADITIEPNVSLYEAAENTVGWATNDILWFRRADHVDPRAYADVALGRASQIPENACKDAVQCVPDGAVTAIDLSAELRHWRCHYCTLLKIAGLQRHSLTPSDQLAR